MTTYQWANPGLTMVATSDGRYVPATADNQDYADLLASGAAIAPYAPPPPTAEDVRAEASRRMCALVSARNAEHLAQIIQNGNREAIRLLRIREDRAWTAEEVAREATLRAVDAALEAIRAASNAMEPSPPADYAHASRWP